MKTLFTKKQIIISQIVISTLIPLTSFYGCGGAAGPGPVPVPGVVDLDLDTVSDSSDNCPSVANTNQADLDGDSIGNLCDDDADADTVLATAGDCNDLDATVNPSAADFPDLNYIDSNCDGMDGNSSSAIWVAGDGNDVTGNGSITLPYRTLQKGIDEAVAGSKDVYAASGSYPQGAITLSMKGVRVYGGYGMLSGSVRPRNIDANVVSITGAGILGVIGFSDIPSGHEALLQGVHVAAERGIIVLANKPIIEGNIINVPSVANPMSYAIGFYTFAPAHSELTVRYNQITIGTNTDLAGANIGILVYNPHDGFTLKLNAHNNRIVVSGANKVVAGILGSGATNLAKTQFVLNHNYIENRAGGIYSLGIMLGARYIGGILSSAFFDTASLAGNTILGDRVTTSGSMAIAVGLNKASASTLLQNNILVAGRGGASYGLMAITADVDVLNNTILTSQPLVEQRGINIQGLDPAHTTAVVINNNIIAALDTFGPMDGAITAMSNVVVSEINNNLLDIDYPHYFQNGVVDITSITDMNALAFADNNIEDNPMFVNVASNNFHLASSAAPGVDEGMNLAEVTNDIDGETRATGSYDMGADEIH